MLIIGRAGPSVKPLTSCPGLFHFPGDAVPLRLSLEGFFRENTEDDLIELAAALESDPVWRGAGKQFSTINPDLYFDLHIP